MLTNDIEDFVLSNRNVRASQRHERVIDVDDFSRSFQRELEDFASRRGYRFELIDNSGRRPNVGPEGYMRHLIHDYSDISDMLILVINYETHDFKMDAYMAARKGATVIFA